MPVRPDEVQRIFLDSFIFQGIVPRQVKKLKSGFSHQCFNVTVHFTVNMDLPVERPERPVVVHFTAADPGQPVPAFYITCFSCAQIAVVIIDLNLGNRFKQPLPHIVELQETRNKDRHHKISESLFVDHELEQPVSRIYECAGKFNSFRFIRIKDRLTHLPFQHRTQFPSKIDCITDTGVHPLPAGRTVNMTGITDYEDTPCPEFFSYTVMRTV